MHHPIEPRPFPARRWALVALLGAVAGLLCMAIGLLVAPDPASPQELPPAIVDGECATTPDPWPGAGWVGWWWLPEQPTEYTATVDNYLVTAVCVEVADAPPDVYAVAPAHSVLVAHSSGQPIMRFSLYKQPPGTTTSTTSTTVPDGSTTTTTTPDTTTTTAPATTTSTTVPEPTTTTTGVPPTTPPTTPPDVPPSPPRLADTGAPDWWQEAVVAAAALLGLGAWAVAEQRRRNRSATP